MSIRKIAAAATLALCASLSPSFASTANVDLTSFIQNGMITNSATSTANITSIVYSLGAAGDGIATWDSWTGTGVASDFLSDSRYFQTVTFSLNLAPGSAASFGGLDIDLIESMSPLSVTGSVLDYIGTSLANAFVTVFWSDGEQGTTSLTQQDWAATQHLTVNSQVAPVPLPAAMPLLMAGIAGLGFVARRRKAA